jgi:hypothetical protein
MVISGRVTLFGPIRAWCTQRPKSGANCSQLFARQGSRGNRFILPASLEYATFWFVVEGGSCFLLVLRGFNSDEMVLFQGVWEQIVHRLITHATARGLNGTNCVSACARPAQELRRVPTGPAHLFEAEITLGPDQ